jgi:hypothetical protein
MKTVPTVALADVTDTSLPEVRGPHLMSHSLCEL